MWISKIQSFSTCATKTCPSKHTSVDLSHLTATTGEWKNGVWNGSAHPRKRTHVDRLVIDEVRWPCHVSHVQDYWLYRLFPIWSWKLESKSVSCDVVSSIVQTFRDAVLLGRGDLHQTEACDCLYFKVILMFLLLCIGWFKSLKHKKSSMILVMY